MTGIIAKPAQKRLDRCVSARPRCTKIREPREKCTFGTLKIDNLAPETAVTVENAHQNGQPRGNTKLLGKYRFINLAVPTIPRVMRLLFFSVMATFENILTIPDIAMTYWGLLNAD